MKTSSPADWRERCALHPTLIFRGSPSPVRNVGGGVGNPPRSAADDAAAPLPLLQACRHHDPGPGAGPVHRAGRSGFLVLDWPITKSRTPDSRFEPWPAALSSQQGAVHQGRPDCCSSRHQAQGWAARPCSAPKARQAGNIPDHLPSRASAPGRRSGHGASAILGQAIDPSAPHPL